MSFQHVLNSGFPNVFSMVDTIHRVCFVLLGSVKANLYLKNVPGHSKLICQYSEENKKAEGWA